jgi:hypothetical protein
MEMKEHPTHKGCFVTEDGRVFSNAWDKLKELKQHQDGHGYYHVSYKCKTRKVHRLIAETFIPNSNNLPQVNHIDRNRLNNRVNNLEWVTNQRNVEHSCAKTFIVQNIKTGEQFEVFNLRSWCRENDVSRSNLIWTLTGKRNTQQAKGYRLLGEKLN